MTDCVFDKYQARLTVSGIAFDGYIIILIKKKSPELMWVEIMPQELDLDSREENCVGR